MMGGVGDNAVTAATRGEKQRSNHHHQQTNTQLFNRPDALLVAQPIVLEH